MRSIHHLCQSVPGALRNWSKREWKSIAEANDSTPERMKEKFRIMEFEGVKVIPIGKECDGFSYETGCPGHPVADSEEASQDG